MSKKHLLAAAVLALMTGVAAAEDEAVIDQIDGSNSTATIEQIFTDSAQAQFGQIFQNAPDTSTATIYQGPTSSAATIDPTAPTSTAPQATAIDPAANHWVDGLTYAPLTGSAVLANFAIIKQDTTATSDAGIVQTTGDDAANLTRTITIGGNTAGIDGGALTDGVNAFDAGLALGDTTVNFGNIAGISQAAEVTDRAGTVLGGTAQAAGATGEAALIVQLGSNNIAQVLQAGDTEAAVVIQDGNLNDAFVAQYGTNGSATVTQLAIGDIATVYQSGDANTAYIYQHVAQ